MKWINRAPPPKDKDKEKFDYTVLCIETGQEWTVNQSLLRPDWFVPGDLVFIDGNSHMFVRKELDLDDDNIILRVKW